MEQEPQTQEDEETNLTSPQGENQRLEDHIARMRDGLATINSEIVDMKSKMNAAVKSRRNSLIASALGVVFLVAHYTQYPNIPTWIIICVYAFVFLAFTSGMGSDPEKHRVEIEKTESLKRVYFGFLDADSDEKYFDQLVKINIENLGDYYSLVRIHTGHIFRASLVVSLIGFALISAGLAISFLKDGLRNVTYLATASEIIVEVVAGTMFYMYGKTVRQLKSYHDSLLNVQNILLSFKLIEGTSDAKERSIMTQKMIEFLVGGKNIKE